MRAGAERARGSTCAAFEQQLVLAREERVGVGQGLPPVVERLLGDRQMRIDRHEAARVGAPGTRSTRRCTDERHRSEVECGRRLPGARDVLGSRRHFLVRRATEAMDQASQVPLVEEPGAHAGSAQPMDAGQIDAALLQRVQHAPRVVRAGQADAAHARPPERRAQGTRTRWRRRAAPMRVLPSGNTTSSTRRFPSSTSEGVTLAVTAWRTPVPAIPPPCDPGGCSRRLPASATTPR